MLHCQYNSGIRRLARASLTILVTHPENHPVKQWLQRRSASSNEDPRGFNSTQSDSEYQRDRARIIHSASFRSLQSKTQVLGMGESDFYRTRLTHSLEVAQIGSGICEVLRARKENEDIRELIPSFSLIEAICLAHDIGHSPFGHGGEVAMNTMMIQHGGFEANGQTLRIIARLGEFSAHHGLDLTRRTMLGTIKYPATYSKAVRYRDEKDGHLALADAVPTDLTNIDRWAPPKCVYDNEQDVMDWLVDPLPQNDTDRFFKLITPETGHLKTCFKPFDTSIMELADDIAYGVHDLEDALALGLVERDEWQREVVLPILAMNDGHIGPRIDEYTEKLFSRSNKDRKHAISWLVSHFIRHIAITEDEGFEHDLLRLQVDMEPTAYRILLLIKVFVMDFVIFKPELQMLQYKGQQVVVKLFQIFLANPNRLLPVEVFAQYEQEGPRAIADYLSAMTDVSAGKLYHKLLSPTAGSIFDRS